MNNLKGERLYILVALAAMAVLVIGYVLFVVAFILPQSRARNQAISQLASAEQKLAEARKAQEKSPEKLQAQLATAQATLNQAGSLFLTDAQAAESLNNLSTYASQSDATIISLQANPGSSQEKGAYDVPDVPVAG